MLYFFLKFTLQKCTAWATVALKDTFFFFFTVQSNLYLTFIDSYNCKVG